MESAFDEACRRLAVMSTGPRNRGHAGRNLGGPVGRRNGSQYWLKVGGVYAPDNWHRAGEVEAGAITGVPKPATVQRVEWTDGDTIWAATLMTLILGTVAEEVPWAGARARSMTDSWIAALRNATRQVTLVPTQRFFYTPDEFAAALAEHYGISAAIGGDQWRTAHGDLHWANLMAPLLSILDWECFGAGPPGIDCAWLIAYSCADEELTGRLESAFAPLLDPGTFPAVQLFAAHVIRDTARTGWIDPTLVAPLDRMIDRLLSARRVP